MSPSDFAFLRNAVNRARKKSIILVDPIGEVSHAFHRAKPAPITIELLVRLLILADDTGNRFSLRRISAYAIGILSEVPKFLDSDYVFTTTRRSPVGGFSKMLKRLSERSETTGWRLHDLRRTAASGMARSSVPPYVVEKILNHVSGSFAGVAGVYNRYGYDTEKREALEKWGDFLSDIGA